MSPTQTGKTVDWKPTGWAARIVQHEWDHLQGKMFMDKVAPEDLALDYWKLINARGGDFRLSYAGIKGGPSKWFNPRHIFNPYQWKKHS